MLHSSKEFQLFFVLGSERKRIGRPLKIEVGPSLIARLEQKDTDIAVNQSYTPVAALKKNVTWSLTPGHLDMAGCEKTDFNWQLREEIGNESELITG